MSAVWEKLFGNQKSPVANDPPPRQSALGLSTLGPQGQSPTSFAPPTLGPQASTAPPPVPQAPQGLPLVNHAHSAAPAQQQPAMPRVIVGETFNSIGLRNEGLREQLEKIELAFQNIDGIRASFHEVLSPVDGLIRDLERTKSELFDVSAKMRSKTDALDQLRTEHLEATAARDDLFENHARLKDESQQLETSLRSAETELAENRFITGVKDDRIEQLERDFGNGARRLVQLDDELAALKLESMAREKRLQEIDEQRLSLLDQNTILAQEGRALRARAEDLSATISKLNRQLSELEVRHGEAARRNADLESSALRDAAAHTKFKTAHDETMESHRVRAAALQSEFETVRARHEASERILSESRRELLEKNIAHRDLEQKLADTSVQAASHQKRGEKLADDLTAMRAQNEELDSSRKALNEQYDALARSLRTKEAALARAEKKIVTLDARFMEMKAATDNKRDQLSAKIAELSDQLAAERASRAFAEGALQSARAERLAFNRDAASSKAQPREGSFAVKPDGTREADMPANVMRLHG